MTEAEFAAILARGGLKLSPETQKEIFENCHLLDEMVVRVNRAKAREEEPAVIFVAGRAP